MDKLMKIRVVKLAFLLLLLLLLVSVEGVEDEKGEAGESGIIIDAAKSLFSLPTASWSWTFKLKTLFQQPWHLFSPPNLNFRGGSGGGSGDEDATGTVKEAVMKSFDKSKSTVEDSAKSAAKFTVDNTVNKLKKTLSGKGKLGREEL